MSRRRRFACVLLLASACALPSKLAHADRPAAATPPAPTDAAQGAAPAAKAAAPGPDAAKAAPAGDGSATPAAAASAPAPAGSAVPPAVLAMVGKTVVLKTKDGRAVTGVLVSANEEVFVLDKGGGATSSVQRGQVHSVRLAVPAPPAAPSSSSSEPAESGGDSGAESDPEAQDGPQFLAHDAHPGRGKIIGGAVLLGIGGLTALTGVIMLVMNASPRFSTAGSEATKAVNIFGGTMAGVGGVMLLTGGLLVASGRADKHHAATAAAPFVFEGLSIAPPIPVAGGTTPVTAAAAWSF